ncbi:MAG: hypothetical protein NT149_03660 [Candidatus Gottesmanbacteria bacterium]|nr:hypothetical protein [Candidatus Gottesmanbacteria bacterium]
MDSTIPPQPPTPTPTNSPQPPPTQPITPIPPAPVKPKSNLLPVLIVILLLLSLGAAGFLVYQNRQLKQQISHVQPTPTPLITPIITPDPTANWKTYVDKMNRFSFQYPSTITIVDSNGKFSFIIDAYTVQFDPDGAHQWGEGMSQEQLDKLYMQAFQYPDNPDLKMYPDSAVLFYIEFTSVAEKNSASETIALLDQILSTFKFTN